MSQSKLIYVHDPMCSWCWGYAPTWLKLKSELAGKVAIEYKVGGLAPDSQDPMPQTMQEMLEGTWHKVSAQLGTQFNYDFWRNCQPRRSTYPACRAALIARKADKEAQMVAAIQQAYYLNAQNPSDDSTLISLAEKIGLDVDKFKEDFLAPDTHQALLKEIRFSRSMGGNGFPSLFVESSGSMVGLPIDYQHAQATLESIRRID